jgi:membrane protein YqaA with SNARE-associated domain
MDSTEAYSLLFVDQLVALLLIPVRTPYVLEVMQLFGGYAPHLLFGITIIAAMVATLGNMLLGRLLATCKDKEWIPGDLSWLDGVKPAIRFILPVLIALAVQVPTVGAVPAVAAGFFRVKTQWVILAAFVGSVAWYGLKVL